MKHKLKALGSKTKKFTKLETFPAPLGVSNVTCTSDEVTALCPVTGQPDWYVVEICYRPNQLCVESKTLKLFLQSFRDKGHFCEDFSRIIAEKFMQDLKPNHVAVTVTQKPRGGVSIKSVAALNDIDS